MKEKKSRHLVTVSDNTCRHVIIEVVEFRKLQRRSFSSFLDYDGYLAVFGLLREEQKTC